MPRTPSLLFIVLASLVLTSFGCTAAREGRARPGVPTDVAITLPGDCARSGPLVFVAMSGELEVPLREWTARFMPDVEVAHAPPLPAPRSAWTAGRNQYEGSALLDALDANAENAQVDAATVRPIVIGFIAEDLHALEIPQWRWAFGVFRNRSAVVSLYRMADRPGRGVASQAGAVGLAPEVAARLSRHVARLLGGLYCGFERSGPPTSVMREQVLGVGDLDEIDLRDWRRAP